VRAGEVRERDWRQAKVVRSNDGSFPAIPNWPTETGF
jgi:hypothetical protein